MESKFAYVSLAIAVGSLAVSGTVGLFSLAGNGASVAELTRKVEQLESRLEASDENVTNNRLRIDELDYGLTAVSQLSALDLGQLNALTQRLRDSAVQEGGKLSGSTVAGDEIDFPQFLDENSGEDTANASPPLDSKPPALGIAPLPVQVKVETPARVDGILAQRLSAAWNKPKGELKGLKATLLMKLKRDGSLNSVELQESSGNDEFDNTALDAIRNMGQIAEVGYLSESDYERYYQDRALVFAPN